MLKVNSLGSTDRLDMDDERKRGDKVNLKVPGS